MSFRVSFFVLAPIVVAGLLQSSCRCGSGADVRISDPAPAPARGDARPAEIALEGPAEKLPREVESWRMAGPPRYFGPDDLFELIDGGAEVYVEYGLVRMATVDYGADDLAGVSVTAEVYDMGSPLGAFGRTSRFLDERLDPSGAGEGLPEGLAERGILGSGDLVFWKDRFLVHLTLMDGSPSASPESIDARGRSVLPLFAGSIASGMTGAAGIRGPLDSFPSSGRIARSESWRPSGALGPGSVGGWSARYAEGDRSWTLVVTEEMDEEALAAARSGFLGDLVGNAGADGHGRAAIAAGGRLVAIEQRGEPFLADDRISDILSKTAEALTGGR